MVVSFSEDAPYKIQRSAHNIDTYNFVTKSKLWLIAFILTPDLIVMSTSTIFFNAILNRQANNAFSSVFR